MLSLCRTIGRAPKKRIHRRVVGLRSRGEAGVLAELRNIIRKKNGGRGASSRGLVGRIGFFAYFFVGDATQVTSR